MRPPALIALLAAAATLCAGGGISSAAPTAFPGTAGRIAFIRVIAGLSSSGVPLAAPPTVYTVRKDGRDARPLTGRAAFDYEPAWSPDGTIIAFRRVTDPPRYESSEIYLAHADGSGLERLTRNAEAEKNPSWSPDASRIAFERGGAIWVMRADGTHPRRLVPGAGSPSWSPDGRWIAYGRGETIGLVRFDGSDRRRLARSEYYGDKFGFGEPVDWTPDGRVAFVAGTGSVQTMTTAGTHIRQVGDGRQPAWSPDGRFLVVTVFGDVEPFSDRLDVLATDGSRRRQLTRSTYPVQDSEADWQPLCTRRGGSRGDLISGTRRDDLLCGLGGSDVIDGAEGEDRLFGGPGNDNILSRDGAFDVVGCGPGRDVAVADHLDLIGADCERVRRR